MLKNKIFFLLLVASVHGLKFQKNELIKITHCTTTICKFYAYGHWLYVKSRLLQLNEKLHVPHAKWNETRVKNVKGGILLNIPKYEKANGYLKNLIKLAV